MPIRHIARLIIVVTFVLAATVLWRRYGPDLAIMLRQLHGRRSVSHSASTDLRNTRDLQANLMMYLHALETDTGAVSEQLFLEQNTLEMRAAVPRGRPDEWVIWWLGLAAERTPYRVADCYPAGGTDGWHMVYRSANEREPSVRLTIKEADRYYSETAKIAFLVEDFGFEANQTTVEFLSFPHPLTVSLLPTQSKSEWTAKIADHYQKEIIIHLPLEPLLALPSDTEAKVIMVHYDDEKIRKMVLEAMRCIPSFSGFSNLWGGRALQDSRVMRIVLSEVQEHHGYFVDTRTTPGVALREVVNEVGVPFREVDAIIPAEAGKSELDSLVAVYTYRAQRSGTMLVSGSPTQAFIHALQERMQFLEYNGIKLVYVSEIVEHPDET